MDRYDVILSALFVRFPSVSKEGFSAAAYKPGLGHMRSFDALLGHPSEALKTIHIAGTNGKGSVSSMLAAVLAARGLRVGLFTSPHLVDFRERIKIVDASGFRMIGREDVLDFVDRWNTAFDRLELSFFEITTGLAFDWFVREQVDVAVIEVGLGGRLDSTNILTPELSIVTSIGLDHCAQLGSTRAAIAGEKAGIFKPGVPALVGERDEETAPVFEFAAAAAPCPLFFADEWMPAGCPVGTGTYSAAADKLSAKQMTQDARMDVAPCLQGAWPTPETAFDLKGEYQANNLRTVLAALELLGVEPDWDALAHTAARTGLRGRWEILQDKPLTICDIGHNPPALCENFAQLERMMASGRFDRLLIVYGIMADKALDEIIPLMPRDADYYFATPNTPRALPAADIAARFQAALDRTDQGSAVLSDDENALDRTDPGSAVLSDAENALDRTDRGSAVLSGPDTANPSVKACGSVADAIREAQKNAGENALIYIGGSTFVVSEAITYFETL